MCIANFTMYAVQCISIMNTVHCTLYSVHCTSYTLYSVCYTVYIVYYSEYREKILLVDVNI